MIKIGMLIADRYEILEKIGTGGMSDVYKAKDHKLNRFVAVKVLKQEFSENANFVSKFRVEAQAAAGLMHPNIVNVYDVGEEKGVYYIVMELVDGITLKKYIEKKARLSVKEAISIAIQVSMGLEAAHKNHIIHRDIKPQNIIISKEGKVKVTDFGIAKAATSNTITSNVMGSVHYTSPEQARGGYSDEKSDIYSLGITIFEMLTGRVPFNGETTVAIAIKHIQQPMPSPCNYVPEIPFSVEQIVLKCCEKSPDRRYQNIGELISDLKQSLLHPDDDFVRMVNPDEESATRMVNSQERQDIRHQYDGNQDMEYPVDDDRRDDVRTDSYRKSYSGNRSGARPDGNRRPRKDYSYDSRDYEEQPLRLKDDVRRRYNQDDYSDDFDLDRDYNPKMEKMTTVLSILAAILIGGIIIFFAARAMGLLPGGQTDASQTAESGMVSMIDVVGLDQEEAKAQLIKLGLTPEITYAESSSSDSGIVLSMDTPAGTMVAEGSNVVLTVSAGANGISVPSVIGLTTAEAVSTLEKKGFVVNKAESSDDKVEKGNVISQNPDQGQAAPSGSTVTITISTGPENDGKIAVPSVTGLREEDAMALLTEAGLQMGNVVEVTNEDANLKGLVCAQSVAEGTYVDKDTAIDLQVSKGVKNATYSYSADVTAPTAAEDPAYVPGTSVYVVIITSDGSKLLDTTTTSFPLPVSFTGLTTSSGTLQMSYTDSTQASVTTDPNTGETISTPGGSEQKTITRPLTFTAEN